MPHVSFRNTTACADINAGAFHILLTNMIALQNKGFVIDRDRSIQVWNQPVFGYNSRVLDSREPSHSAAPTAVKEVFISTKARYTVEVNPQWYSYSPREYSVVYKYVLIPGPGMLQSLSPLHSLTMDLGRYWVELDSNNQIVGGHYTSWLRTDFTWMMASIPAFSGYFVDVAAIYKASTAPDGGTVLLSTSNSSPIGP